MSQANIDRFTASLHELEITHKTEPLVRLFGTGSTLDSPAHQAPLAGRDGAEVFWGEYLEAFKEVKSAFTHVQDLGDTAILEWKSVGTLPTGKPIEYRGVSLVTFAGERVKRFVTYYDSAQFIAESNMPMTVETGWKNDNGGD